MSHSCLIGSLDDRVIQRLSSTGVKTVECISRDAIARIIQELEESIHLVGGGSLVGCHLRDPEFRDAVLRLEFLVCLHGLLERSDVGGFTVVVESEDVDVAALVGDAVLEEGGHVLHTHAGIREGVGRGWRDELHAATPLWFHVCDPCRRAVFGFHLGSTRTGGLVGFVEAHEVGVPGGVLIPDGGVIGRGAQQHGDELDIESAGGRTRLWCWRRIPVPSPSHCAIAS